MNRHYQHHVLSNRSGSNLDRKFLLSLVLGGLLLFSGCASTPSNRSSCPATPETVTATQSQAEAGEAASQYQVGLWYRYASGCLKRDELKAVEWFRRAAEQGHADAQYELGRMYFYRYGIEQDDEEAARWLQLAAEQDHSRAARLLGDLYARSGDVARDFDLAEYWYRQAFAGNAISQTELDRLLDNLDKIRDPVAWEREQQRLSEEKREAEEKAKHELERITEERQQEQQRLAEEGKRLAEENKQERHRLADEGDPEAQYQLGILYSGGSNDVEQDLDQAFTWFQKSADQGDPRAQYKLGEFYIAASNDSKSVQAWADAVSSDTLIGDWGGRFESSISWWPNGEIKLRITEKNNENYTGHVLKIPGGNPSLICKGAPIKLNRRGNRYAVTFNRRNVCQAEGEFVYTDQRLYGEVLFKGSRRVGISLTRLGRDISNVQTLAADNDQVERNFTLAAPWFEKSADQGYANAQFALGLMHEAGIGGISKDIDKAKDLYQKAADQEHYLANQQICALSENCTPAPKPNYPPGPKSTGGGAEALFVLCLLTPYIQWACAAAMGGSM